jgi:hypothetical protein
LTFLPKEGLEILFGKYWVNDAKVECSECKEWGLCRSVCLSCSTNEQQKHYCTICRQPPCSKSKCPLGHPLKTRKKAGKNRFCDLCDVPAGLMSSSEVHGFCKCDFDLCGVCFAKLPENDSRIPMKWNSKKLWPLSRVSASDEDESDWK